jgi:hypothetical protein
MAPRLCKAAQRNAQFSSSSPLLEGGPNSGAPIARTAQRSLFVDSRQPSKAATPANLAGVEAFVPEL